jgi:regulation of enolase protein 1 (concanavalin A-like superfamily)
VNRNHLELNEKAAQEERCCEKEHTTFPNKRVWRQSFYLFTRKKEHFVLPRQSISDGRVNPGFWERDN